MRIQGWHRPGKIPFRDKPVRLNARLFFLLEIILFVTAFLCGWGAEMFLGGPANTHN